MMPPITTINVRISSDKALLSAINRMYLHAVADVPACRHVQQWRDQVSYLIDHYGRGVVLEQLQEEVPSLNTRDAMALADLAEREESGVRV